MVGGSSFHSELRWEVVRLSRVRGLASVFCRLVQGFFCTSVIIVNRFKIMSVCPEDPTSAP